VRNLYPDELEGVYETIPGRTATCHLRLSDGHYDEVALMVETVQAPTLPTRWRRVVVDINAPTGPDEPFKFRDFLYRINR